MIAKMSAQGRTTSTSLSLLPASGGAAASETELPSLPPSLSLEGFLGEAARAGLEPAEAVRLALERALVLQDACEFPLDVESARRLLRRAAAGARPQRELPPGLAAYLRELSARRPCTPPRLQSDLQVELPERLLIRARAEAGESAFHAGAVAEMIAWEIAAVLKGRTMAEWSLRVLAHA